MQFRLEKLIHISIKDRLSLAKKKRKTKSIRGAPLLMKTFTYMRFMMSVETLNSLNCNACFDHKVEHHSLAARLSNLLVRVFDVFNKGIERQRTRHHLAMLDDHMLHDIGLSRAEIEQELDKPFWR
jgi:uncharacterized protein YjiS (DUF1127 family)